ncbi:ornithine cyclodeaminase family protein [Rhodococcoides kyotonense]|uniref:Ornithine cyclodeaminase n=1 Tax=Rhodococcoides kyotonense TaxID=398843 RepID=A0A239HML8_9NOCA|nr:ornithine cyclodeaminase family protein [Rhodococcus kyotonensis]SNS82590.1 ornithine cyclodeaminase [Rhodococcus kyotonensis]
MTSPPDTATHNAIAVFTDEQVIASVDRRTSIIALRDVLVSAHRGTAHSIPKTMAQFDTASTAHSLGAVDTAQQIVAFKSWVNTPNGASALLSLFDAVDGRTLAVMSAGALGMLRTACTAALATDILADPAASELAIVGTGRQAFHQVAAIHDVRPLELVRVWSPTEESRTAFADLVGSTLGIRTEIADTARNAVTGAPIVTTITRATEPFLDGEWLARGAHLNAVGAILPTSAELLPSVLPLSDLTVVDDIDNATRASRELKEHFGNDLSSVPSLGEVIDRDVTRPDDPRLTVYKGLGSGLTDLAVAALVARAPLDSKDNR